MCAWYVHEQFISENSGHHMNAYRLIISASECLKPIDLRSFRKKEKRMFKLGSPSWRFNCWLLRLLTLYCLDLIKQNSKTNWHLTLSFVLWLVKYVVQLLGIFLKIARKPSFLNVAKSQKIFSTSSNKCMESQSVSFSIEWEKLMNSAFFGDGAKNENIVWDFVTFKK